jgi:SAM-dependent methyltransferase
LLERETANGQVRTDLFGALLRGGSLLVDRFSGVDTIAHGVDGHGSAGDGGPYDTYDPSRRMLLRAVLPRARVSPTDVFVDIGSGKGRILLEAATRYRFRRIIGVELLPALTATAARNLRTTRRRLRTPEVELVTGDAREWVPPDDLTIAYMFNPFRGEVFDTVVGNLAALVDRRGDPLLLIYANPVEHERLMESGAAVEMPSPGGGWLRLARIPARWVRVYELRPRRTHA